MQSLIHEIQLGSYTYSSEKLNSDRNPLATLKTRRKLNILSEKIKDLDLNNFIASHYFKDAKLSSQVKELGAAVAPNRKLRANGELARQATAPIKGDLGVEGSIKSGFGVVWNLSERRTIFGCTKWMPVQSGAVGGQG